MKPYARLVGSAALLAVLAWRVDLARVGAALAGVRGGWWAAAVFGYAFAQLVSSVRWRLLAGPLGFRGTAGRFALLTFVGTFFNLLLPTSVGGDLARAWYLDAGSGRRGAAFLTVLADRLSGLFVLAALALAASLLVPVPSWVRLFAAGVGGASVAGILALLLAPGGGVPGSSRRGGRLREALAAYRRAPHVLLLATSLSVVVQVVNVVLVWLLARSLGLGLGPGVFFVVVPLVALLTLAPVSINGLGVREGGMVLLLSPLVAPERAVTLSLLWFSVFVAAGLAGAGCYLFGRLPRYGGRVDEAEPVGGDPDQGRARQPRAAA